MDNIKRYAKCVFGVLHLMILLSIVFVVQGCGEVPEDGITVSDVVAINPQLGECLLASKPSIFISLTPWEDTLAKDVHSFRCDLFISDDNFKSLNGIELLTGLTQLILFNINLSSIELKGFPDLSSAYLSSLDGNVLDIDVSNLSKLETLRAFDVGDIALPPNNKLKNISLSLAQRVDGEEESQLDLSMLNKLESLTLNGKFSTDSAQIIDLTNLTALQELSLTGSFSEVLLPIAGSLNTFLYDNRGSGPNAKPFNIDFKRQDYLSSLTLLANIQDVNLPDSGSLETLTYITDKRVLKEKPLSIDLSKQHSLKQLTLSGNFRPLSFPEESAIEELYLELIDDSPIMLNLINLKGLKSTSLTGYYSEIKFPLEPSLVTLSLNLKKEFPELPNANFKSLKSLALELSGMDQNLIDLKSYEVLNIEKLSLLGGDSSNIILPNLLYLTRLKLDAKMEFLDLGGSPKLSYVDLDTPNLTRLTFNENAPLRGIKVSDSQLISLDLSENNSENLVEVVLSKSDVVEIEFPACGWLKELTIERAPNLKHLDLSNCSNLTSLVLGRNSLPSLDLTSAWNLRVLEYYSPPTLKQVDLNHLAEPDIRIYKYPLIAELDETLVPDPVLRKCIRTAAEEANAVFLAEIERLDCIGDDDPSHLESLVEFATGSGEYENTRVFDTTGINHLKNLKYLNLAGNWISKVNLDGLYKLKAIVLDNNVIQDLALGGYSDIETLSINENPLKYFNVSRVKNLLMKGGVEWLNTQAALKDFVDISEMKTGDGEFLTEADYNEPVVLVSSNGFPENIVTNREYRKETILVW